MRPREPLTPVAAGAEAGPVYRFAKHFWMDLKRHFAPVIRPSIQPASGRRARARASP